MIYSIEYIEYIIQSILYNVLEWLCDVCARHGVKL